MFDPKLFIKSVANAGRGVKTVWKNEQNFRFQVLIGVIVVALAIVLPISVSEKNTLFLLVCLVLVAEISNTVFEKISDIIKPRIHPYVEQIKDMMAAIVLIISITAAVIGVSIFIPAILKIVG